MFHTVSGLAFVDQKFKFFSGFLAAAALAASGTANAEISFEEASGSAGISYVGESFGSSWSDVNADGYPDLYVNNHRSMPSLYLNNGDGTFTDIAGNVGRWAQDPHLDQHGAAWGDFNGDGFPDLMQSMGATDENQLLENFSGQLVDRAADYGALYRNWPGRLPIWLDANFDGKLDWTVMQRGRARLLVQTENGAFSDQSVASGFSCNDTQYGQLIDLNGDRRLELLCGEQIEWPDRVFDLSTKPFTDVTSLLPTFGSVNDSVIGDFNNDLKNDLFIIRGILRPSGAEMDGIARVEAQLIVDNATEEQISFQSTGVITVTLDWSARNRERIFIGSAGVNPTGFSGTERIVFKLDPAKPETWGIKPHNSATENGVYMGFNPETSTWTFQVTAAGDWNYTYWGLDSTAPIANLALAGVGGAESGIRPVLLLSGKDGFSNMARTNGFNPVTNCVSGVAADFDNDMDMDIYVACRNGVSNASNLLYENQGDGTFLLVPGAGGAAGPVGLRSGQAESVTVADYDADGFVDLYVTNGLGLFPENPDSVGGPDLLFRNRGNSNSWIELELQGTTSNSSAIGASVIVTAGGVSQLREQNGGYHRWAQDHQRLHFGLGSNNVAAVTVRWPNGATEYFQGVTGKRIYKVVEGKGISVMPISPEPGGDPAPTISISNVAVNESVGRARLMVSLSAPAKDTVSVRFATRPGLATPDTDYVSASGTITFAPGETQKWPSFRIKDDSVPERGERFFVDLSGAVNAELARTVGWIRIIDND